MIFSDVLSTKQCFYPFLGTLHEQTGIDYQSPEISLMVGHGPSSWTREGGEAWKNVSVRTLQDIVMT